MIKRNLKDARFAILLFLSTGISLLMPHVSSGQLPAPSFYHLKRDFELFSAWYWMPFEDPSGFIWFGSSSGGGLYRYDGYDLLCFHADPNRKTETIATDLIFTIYLAPDSNLYAGTILGFTKLDMITGSLKNYITFYDSLPDEGAGLISALQLDTFHHKLWIGTLYGLMSMDTKTEKFTQLRPLSPINERMPDNIMQIYQDSVDRNKLWLISGKGLFSYNIDTKQYSHMPIPGTPHNNNIVFGIRDHKSSTIWISNTTTDFISSYHPPSNTWKNYPVKTVQNKREHWMGILPLNENECWISGDSSVGRLDLRTGVFESWKHNKNYPDGLLHNGMFRGLLNDRHGRLWVTSFQGVQYAKAAFLPKSNCVKQLKVQITNVEVVPVFEAQNKPLLYKDILELKKDQRDISFQYVLPNPLDKNGVLYRYKLVGQDNDWIQTDQRRVRYSKLAGGNYTFMVTGKEGDHADWLPVNEIKISIDKRISELWWFWTGLAIAVGLIAVAIYQWLIDRARKEERLKSEFENKLSEIQMQALRAQMNPHFLFNSLNSIKYFAISKGKDETAAYLSKFALLVRSILNNSKSRTISLKDELDALKLYIEIEHLRLEGKFDYKIEIDKGIHISQAQIPPMILQPYVENAIWHGLMHKNGKGYLLVEVRDLGNQIQCVIEDNGVGRKHAAEMRASKMDHKKSVGMQITNDRIALINKIYDIDTKVNVIDLADEEGIALGTRVVIHVPLIKDEEE